MKPDYDVRLKTNGAGRLMVRVTGKIEPRLQHEEWRLPIRDHP
uniref:Uncharacterized protein n=1 Tax=Candidatus Kentrum sp. TC TaxID=2126339 RepID=A0A451A1I2_9GAMM|nr:MAG: hypothetical protein BECKTC1821F_GA0114240_103822 [Candidatus Kentron sp. TC]